MMETVKNLGFLGNYLMTSGCIACVAMENGKVLVLRWYTEL